MIQSLPTLQQGSQGPYVEILQLALTRADTNPGFIDGIFGRTTLRAVILFQRRNGLAPDGIVGEKTKDALIPYITGYVPVTIQSGDSFYRLARRYNTTSETIITANPGINPLNMVPGQIINVPLNFNIVPTAISYTSLLNHYCLQGLKARYPFITLKEIGGSQLETPLTVATIGNGPRQVFYNAAHHANEWITIPILLKFIEDFAKAYTTNTPIYDTDSKELFNTATIHILSLVNPDGVDLVTGALNNTAVYQNALQIANNYPDIPFPEGWKANIEGTDLNLNYPALWETAREIKYGQGFTTPAPRDFVGTSPLSASESQAVYSYTLNNNFALTISYHTQGRVIYWKFADFMPPDARAFGETFSRISGYTLEDTPYSSAFAGYKDWFIQNYNQPGYTMEAGRGLNPLPISQFPGIYKENLGVLVYGALGKML
ncbi:MAG: LysM peptidoglycan-binding domain-containing protein [Ruminococcaceae bacterium]|nr:LysM peptidoglycan-binding domain-containing protein [Oscillospiraceae bacterium]